MSVYFIIDAIPKRGREKTTRRNAKRLDNALMNGVMAVGRR